MNGDGVSKGIDIYLFSGLGADSRAFQFLDLTGFNVIHIDWLSPQPNETIENYAKRLSKQITSKNPVLIGLSFGGMMAVEVAKQISTDQVILISSAKSKNEIPFYFRFIGLLGLHKIIPASLMKRSNVISNWLFGVQRENEKGLLSDILKDTDSVFLKWAIHAIVTWTNEKLPSNIIHIHGTADKILPCRFIKPNLTIKNGGHFMVVNKSKEVADLLRNLLG